MDFDDFTALFTLLLIFFWIEKIYQTFQTLFYRLLKQLEFLKTISLRFVFSILWLVFGYPDKTLSVVCDIYHVL